MPGPNVSELRCKTELYWENQTRSRREQLVYYLTDLLPDEVAHSRDQGRWTLEPEGTGKQVGTLVLLVGFAYEPLAQSICFYQPSRIALVLNRKYGDDSGIEHGKTLERALEQAWGDQRFRDVLKQKPVFVFPRNCELLRADSPASTFRFLRDCLKDLPEPKERLVVDVTGGKKSMVAGAFFFAAYSGIEVSYVDFDEYSPFYSRPYGYSSHIGLIENPYQAFQLERWKRLRTLYARHDYAASLEVGREILDAMRARTNGEAFFQESESAAVEKMLGALEVYRDWEAGDYSQACSKSQGLSETLGSFEWPRAISVLSDWPRVDENADSPSEAANGLIAQMRRSRLLETPSELAMYVADEFARIGRLVNRDARSALIRAVGLHELLLQARAMALWRLGLIKAKVDAPQTRDSEEQETRQILLGLATRQLNALLDVGRTRWKDRESGTSGEFEPASEFRVIGHSIEIPKSIRDLRNKTTHQYLHVPETVAEEALRKARDSWAEYCKTWAPLVDPKFQPPNPDGPASDHAPWTELCRVFGIDFLPPALEDKE